MVKIKDQLVNQKMKENAKILNEFGKLLVTALNAMYMYA